MIIPIPHEQFLSGSIGRVELLAFAALLGWPEITYQSWGPRTIAAGEFYWRSECFEMAAARRSAYLALITIEHDRIERS